MSVRKYFPLIFTGILVVFYVGFLILVRRSFPTSEELLSSVSSFYGNWGYEIVFIASLVEALILINLFVPGTVAVGLGAVFARVGELDLTIGIILAVFGALLGYILDYCLGFFGLSKVIESLGFKRSLEKSIRFLQISSIRSFSLAFIHPNIGAIASFAAGSLKMNFTKFLTLSSLSTIAWYSLWGILGFALGEVFLKVLTKYAFVLLIFILSVWILAIVYGRLGRRR